MTPVERLLATALAEEGYLEKASNANLDSKTGNAGDKNWTKYARDLDALGLYNGKKNGYAWCDMFCDWCFVRTFGLELAMQMTGQPTKNGYGAGCTESVRYYKKIERFFSKPMAGDQIFFTNDGGKTFCHTGLVVAVKNGYVHTIEGNTSSQSGVVANGGAVRQKSYLLTYRRIGGYGRPKYDLAEEEIKMEDVKAILENMTDKQAYEILTKAQAYTKTLTEPTWSVAEGHWKTAEAKKLMSGAPEGLLKRDEFAAILGRMNLL